MFTKLSIKPTSILPDLTLLLYQNLMSLIKKEEDAKCYVNFKWYFLLWMPEKKSKLELNMNRHIQLTRYLNHAHPQYTWRFERTLNFIINCSNNTFLSAFVYLQCFTLNRWLRKRTRQNAKQPPSNMNSKHFGPTY